MAIGGGCGRLGPPLGGHVEIVGDGTMPIVRGPWVGVRIRVHGLG